MSENKKKKVSGHKRRLDNTIKDTKGIYSLLKDSVISHYNEFKGFNYKKVPKIGYVYIVSFTIALAIIIFLAFKFLI